MHAARCRSKTTLQHLTLGAALTHGHTLPFELGNAMPSAAATHRPPAAAARTGGATPQAANSTSEPISLGNKDDGGHLRRPPSINKGVRSAIPLSHKGVKKGVRGRIATGRNG